MNALGIDPGLTGAVVLEGPTGPLAWAMWVHRKRKAGDVWEVLASHTTLQTCATHWSAVVEAVGLVGMELPGPDVAVVEDGCWRGSKSPDAIEGFGFARGLAVAAIEDLLGLRAVSVSAPNWRRRVLRLHQTPRATAEREAVRVALGPGAPYMPPWPTDLPLPPEAQRVHVAEARCMAVWGMAHHGR